MELQWLGHACFRIRKGGRTLYVDPFISGNPVCPIDLEDVDEADWVLVSHGHHDHYGDAVELVRRTGGTLVAAFEITEDAGERGVDAAEPMNIGGSVETGGITVHMTEAQHTSGPGLGHPAGFVIEWGEHRVYHAGDTGLFSDMQLIAEFLEPDLAMLPIGDRFTMGPRSAGRAVDFLGVNQVIPMHYNTFELVEQNPAEFEEAVGDAADVIVLNPGESHRMAGAAG